MRKCNLCHKPTDHLSCPDGDGYRDLFFGNSAGELVWLRGGEPGEYDEILPLITEAEKGRMKAEELRRILR